MRNLRPYIELNLLVPQATTSQKRKFTTNHKSGTTSPIFNQSFKLWVILRLMFLLHFIAYVMLTIVYTTKYFTLNIQTARAVIALWLCMYRLFVYNPVTINHLEFYLNICTYYGFLNDAVRGICFPNNACLHQKSFYPFSKPWKTSLTHTNLCVSIYFSPQCYVLCFTSPQLMHAHVHRLLLPRL